MLDNVVNSARASIAARPVPIRLQPVPSFMEAQLRSSLGSGALPGSGASALLGACCLFAVGSRDLNSFTCDAGQNIVTSTCSCPLFRYLRLLNLSDLEHRHGRFGRSKSLPRSLHLTPLAPPSGGEPGQGKGPATRRSPSCLASQPSSRRWPR